MDRFLSCVAVSYLPECPTRPSGPGEFGCGSPTTMADSQETTPSHGQVSLLTSLHLRSIPSPTTPCRPDALSGVFYTGLTVGRVQERAEPSRAMRLGLRLWLAGSPRQQAESSSRCYGLDFRLRLLSTLLRRNAVTISYEGPDAPRQGLSPCQYNDITGALA
jgi:hypothetical protein